MTQLRRDRDGQEFAIIRDDATLRLTTYAGTSDVHVVSYTGIGFQMGPRAPGLDVDARHDVVVALEVERWQGVVGPRVGIRALQAVGDGAWPDWAAPCGIDSPERAGLTPLEVLIRDR